MDDSRRLWIIPDSEFKKDCDESTPVFKTSRFIEFQDAFNYIEVMDDSKMLAIGFVFLLDIYNIEKDPLCPKLIKRFDYNGIQMRVHLKVDENLILV